MIDLETVLNFRTSLASPKSELRLGLLQRNKEVKAVSTSQAEIDALKAAASAASGGTAVVEGQTINPETGEIEVTIAIPDAVAAQVIEEISSSAAAVEAFAPKTLPKGIRNDLTSAGANAALLTEAERLAGLGFPPGIIKAVALNCLPDNAASLNSLAELESQRASGLSFGKARSAAIAAGCVSGQEFARYTFNNTLADFLGNGPNVSVQAGATSFVPAKVNQGIQQDIAAPTLATLNPELPGTGSGVPFNGLLDMSIEGWVRLPVGFKGFSGLVTKGKFPNVGMYGIVVTDGRIGGFAHGQGGAIRGIVSGQQQLVDGNFHHLAMVRRGGTTIKVFVDGALSGSVEDAGGALGADGQNVKFFLLDRATAAPFFAPQGTILDEISFYNKALSDAEVQAIFAAGSAGKP